MDFEQKTSDYGTTTLKLLRVTETTGGGVRVFGNILLSEKHYKEADNEMLIVRIISLSGSPSALATIRQSSTVDKLSLNKISALVNHRTNTIDFGPVQGVYVDETLRGHGIGTFALNEVVSWLKRDFPEYSINPFEFAGPENSSEDMNSMRNHFLENFGFSVGFTDVTQRSGTMKAKKPAVLKEYFNSQKIEELDIEQFVFNLIKERSKLEKDYGELKVEFAARGEELLRGIPKSEIIKYTIVGSALIVIVMILLLI